jgi:glycosyltransferase involved in cell wall biosynthesis
VAGGVRSYRMFCVQSNMFRDGKECRECLGSRLNLPAIRHGCYQGRAASSAPMALGLAVHRGTWQLVDRFLAVSDFVKQELITYGIPAERIQIRDNFVSDRGRVDTPGDGFVFAGRLGTEKGIEMLLDAWQRSEVWRSSRLVVAGSGPADQLVRGVDPSFHVEAAGLVPHLRALELVRAAAVVVVPSLWHEPFGRGVAEAASMSRPALVTDRGGLPELVTDGLTGWVSRADVDSFAAALRAAADPAEQVRRGREARLRYEQRFTAERSLDVLHTALDELASR